MILYGEAQFTINGRTSLLQSAGRRPPIRWATRTASTIPPTSR